MRSPLIDSGRGQSYRNWRRLLGQFPSRRSSIL